MRQLPLLALSIAFVWVLCRQLAAADELVVHPPVPGLAASEHHQVRVRSVCTGSEPQFLWGQADARIRYLTFESLTVGGKPVRGLEFFQTNYFVDVPKFIP